jgi:hypothetical protein
MRSCWAAPFLALAMVLCACSSSPLPISVSLSPTSPLTIDQGLPVAITATLTNDRSSKGVTWTLNGPGYLSSSTGFSVTYNSPATNLTSAQQATVTAASVADPTQRASLTITVNPGLAISILQTLPNGTVGQPYSEPIAITGGTAPFEWSIYNGPIGTGWKVGGSVPEGLTLDSATGTISGTPTAAGTWYFEATVRDADGASADDGFLSIQIDPGSAAAANPAPFLNQPLTPAAVAPGGPAFTLSVSGSGFASDATVDLNGVPLATTFIDRAHLSALVQAANVAAAQTASVTVVNPAPGGGSSNAVLFQVGAPETAINFSNAVNSPLQIPEPFAMSIADFNQDGKPDLAVAANTRLYVMLGNGGGTFAPAPGSPVPMPSPPYDDFGSPYVSALTVADFNHSGHPGVAAGLLQNEASVILLGNGDGTFSYSSSLANTVGAYTGWLTAADFNGDGNLDLIAFTTSGQTVLLGYGSGAFNSVPQNTPIFGTSSAVGDLNGDGKLDLAVAGGSEAAVLLGNGDGTFTQVPASQIPVGRSLSAIVAADFNRDGKLDLAVTDAVGNTVLLLLGNGDGTFQAPITIPVGHKPDALAVGDFNNDGELDLAVANNGDNTVTLLLGNGDGNFTEASGSPYAVGTGPNAITAADFNGDGKLDLAVMNGTAGTISILLQQ